MGTPNMSHGSELLGLSSKGSMSSVEMGAVRHDSTHTLRSSLALLSLSALLLTDLSDGDG